MPAHVLKEVVCGPLEDVKQVAWSCWPIAVWYTSLISCPNYHPSVVVIPEKTPGSGIAESADSGARLPPYNLGRVS